MKGDNGMKISLITIHDVGNNYGSTLQSCALYRYIQKLGYEVELVDYKPQYKSLKGRVRTFVVNLMFLVSFLKREKRFKNYYLPYMELTCSHRTYKSLCKNPPQADVYMVGSDQVWNVTFPCGQDDAYYLNYIDSPNKMSYASSLGRAFNVNQLCNLKQKIRNFSYVSVRERFSSIQLSTVGVNAKYVLDPVFLLSRSEYLQDVTLPPCKNYLLVYAINEDELLNSVAQRIALERNLKIVLIGGFAKKIKCDIFYRSAGPREFLNLIANADFVLTSSFHGTAFSLIFNKQFAIVQPKINSLRIEDMLNSLAITDRVIKTFDDFEIHKKSIDYYIVNQKLDSLIVESKKYLIHSLRDLESRIMESDLSK